MYTHKNYQTKAALKRAVANGEQVTVYQPGLGDAPGAGRIVLEGPHDPQPHRWYAEAILERGVVVKVT